MPSPFTHGLVPTLCALSSAASRGPLSRAEKIRLGLAALLLANLPDADLIPGALFPSHFDQIHRQLGHNLFSVTLAIAFGAWWLRRYVSTSFEGRRGWIYSAALVLSHVVLDACGDTVPGTSLRAGVPLLWPLSDWQFSLPLPLFGGYRLAQASHPLLRYLHTPDFWRVSMVREVCFVPLFTALWYGATLFAGKLLTLGANRGLLRAHDSKSPGSGGSDQRRVPASQPKEPALGR